jgi:hypothetical protein
MQALGGIPDTAVQRTLTAFWLRTMTDDTSNPSWPHRLEYTARLRTPFSVPGRFIGGKDHDPLAVKRWLLRHEGARR